MVPGSAAARGFSPDAATSHPTLEHGYLLLDVDFSDRKNRFVPEKDIKIEK